MPRYEFRCRECASTFEVDRPMSATGPSPCPDGHADTVKLISTISLGGRGGAPSRAPAPVGGGGGCCGGGCCGGG